MNFEIERKFLVCGDGWRGLVTSQKTIRQAYLATNGKTSIRVRIVDNALANLTIKSRPAELRRLELEYAIPVLEAEALMQLREGSIIEKIRYVVPHGDLAWEIDVFAQENADLIVAELELRNVNQQIELPTWIGQEVTAQSQYYNSFLVRQPFRSWSLHDKMAMSGMYGHRKS